MNIEYDERPLFELEESPPSEHIRITAVWVFSSTSDLYDFEVQIHQDLPEVPVQWRQRRAKWRQTDLVGDLAEAMATVRQGHAMLRTF